MSLKGKFKIMVMVSVAGLLGVAGFWIKNQHSSMLTEKLQKTKNLVEVPYSVIEKQYQLEAEGKISREEAQRRAIEAIRPMRYEGSNYFWINDEHPTMIMHPMKPELDGKDLTTFKDSNGKAMFVEFVSAAQASNGGYVYYLWPKPGKDKPVDKLSFVKRYAPWGWVVGTGIYIDDVDTAWRGNAMTAAWLALACLIPLLAVSITTSRSILLRVRGMVDRVKDVAEGEVVQRFHGSDARDGPGNCRKRRPGGQCERRAFRHQPADHGQFRRDDGAGEGGFRSRRPGQHQPADAGLGRGGNEFDHWRDCQERHRGGAGGGRGGDRRGIGQPDGVEAGGFERGDREGDRSDHVDRAADQSAGAERDHRSGAGGRGGEGIRGGGQRSQGTGQADCESDGRDQAEDHGDPGEHERGGGGDRGDQGSDRQDQPYLDGDCHGGGGTECHDRRNDEECVGSGAGSDDDLEQHSRGGGGGAEHFDERGRSADGDRASGEDGEPVTGFGGPLQSRGGEREASG